MHTCHKDITTSVHWRCSKRGQGCKGSIIPSENSEDVIVNSEHDHPPSDSATNVLKACIVMKEVALMLNEKPATVVTQAMQDLQDEERTMIKSEDSMRRAIRKQRCLAYPPTPHCSVLNTRCKMLWTSIYVLSISCINSEHLVVKYILAQVVQLLIWLERHKGTPNVQKMCR